MSLPQQATILHFSGTGRTWYVAQTYAELLAQRGLACETMPIELGTAEESLLAVSPPDGPLLGIGMPAYGRGLPRQARAWLDQLPAGEGRPAFVFVTCRQQQGKSLTELSQMLTERGYSVLHEAIYLTSSMPWGTTASAASWLRADIGEAVSQMLDGQTRLVPESEALQPPARIVHGGYLLACRSVGRLLQVDDTCNTCMTCLRLCPVGTISLQRAADAREDQSLRIVIGRECILCLRCAALCPQHAIVSVHPRWLPVPAVEPDFAAEIELAYAGGP